MAAAGDIYLGRYEGWYSVRDEAYYDEEELPSPTRARNSRRRGTPVEWTVEESWFFRLSAYQDKLLAHFSGQPDFVRPRRGSTRCASSSKAACRTCPSRAPALIGA
jgi:methionyl-tRNA synthetase